MILYLSIRAFLVALWCQIRGHRYQRVKTLQQICTRCGSRLYGRWTRHQSLKERKRRLKQILTNQLDDAQLIEGTKTWHDVYRSASAIMREMETKEAEHAQEQSATR